MPFYMWMWTPSSLLFLIYMVMQLCVCACLCMRVSRLPPTLMPMLWLHEGDTDGHLGEPLGICRWPRAPRCTSCELCVHILSSKSPSLSWPCLLTGERERISVATVCGPGIMAAAPFPDLRLFSWGDNSAQMARSQVKRPPG